MTAAPCSEPDEVECLGSRSSMLGWNADPLTSPVEARPAPGDDLRRAAREFETAHQVAAQGHPALATACAALVATIDILCSDLQDDAPAPLRHARVPV